MKIQTTVGLCINTGAAYSHSFILFTVCIISKKSAPLIYQTYVSNVTDVVFHIYGDRK